MVEAYPGGTEDYFHDQNGERQVRHQQIHVSVCCDSEIWPPIQHNVNGEVERHKKSTGGGSEVQLLNCERVRQVGHL